jgi:hypothetical protein
LVVTKRVFVQQREGGQRGDVTRPDGQHTRRRELYRTPPPDGEIGDFQQSLLRLDYPLPIRRDADDVLSGFNVPARNR